MDAIKQFISSLESFSWDGGITQLLLDGKSAIPLSVFAIVEIIILFLFIGAIIRFLMEVL